MPAIAKQPGKGPRKTSTLKISRKMAAKPSTPKAAREFATKIDISRIEAVISAAKRSGLLRGKSSRIGGRISPELVKKAKDLTGIKTDTDLIEFALASVALEDRFVEAFKAVRGTVDAKLDLGF